MRLTLVIPDDDEICAINALISLCDYNQIVNTDLPKQTSEHVPIYVSDVNQNGNLI